MVTTIAILLVVLSLSAHELGHALAMRKYGIKIKSISLFGFGKKIFTFRWRKLFGETPIHICIIPLGAYVETEGELRDNELLKGLKNYPAYAHICTAGIQAQLIFASIIASVLVMFYDLSSAPTYFCLTLICVSFLIAFFRKIARILLPCLGFFLIFSLIYTIYNPITTTNQPSEIIEMNGSIVLVYEIVSKFSVDLFSALKISMLMIVGLALSQTVPLYPFDGGLMFTRYLEVRMPSFPKITIFAKNIGLVCTIILTIWAISADIFRLIK